MGAVRSMPNNPSAVMWTAGLLAIFVLKHFLADFLLQSDWMARGKERASDWSVPLAAHVAVHAALTLVIALAVARHLWWLTLVDLAVHAAIDRSKSVVALRFRWTVAQPQFWWLVGLDQALHQMTNVALTVALLLL